MLMKWKMLRMMKRIELLRREGGLRSSMACPRRSGMLGRSPKIMWKLKISNFEDREEILNQNRAGLMEMIRFVLPEKLF